ncbi:hypothetical protein HMPREF0765_4206 [Sphingobacterium spiritivorum ATCC 33300]|uniref:Glycosyl hydrolase family 92 N-terminal domain-containing protein n=1 Tax=Sphingobacterium spiritivorum ATCC 33300 TaxID=525372 RepID=C2G3Q0_SPHSI|nr:hypothetical protein HMPREF0765_4206 [Sphingobacterium spiritivorum ATCC 33300]
MQVLIDLLLVSMKNFLSQFSTCILLILSSQQFVYGQSKSSLTNVFLGSSGDHGQMSPAASSPFHQMSIAPQTYPTLHMGYEYLAKEILGFTHNRFEGVGCKGSGGLILVKPFLGGQDDQQPLLKVTEQAGPGFYEIGLKNKIKAAFAVDENFGIHEYSFPKGKKGFSIDLAHAFNGAFVSNTYDMDAKGMLKGSVRARTTCGVGIYTIHYAIKVSSSHIWEGKGNQLTLHLEENSEKVTIQIAFSAVSVQKAVETLQRNADRSYSDIRNASQQQWDTYLSRIKVKGDPEREKLFYSLFYRTLQPLIRSQKQTVSTQGQMERCTRLKENDIMAGLYGIIIKHSCLYWNCSIHSSIRMWYHPFLTFTDTASMILQALMNPPIQFVPNMRR